MHLQNGIKHQFENSKQQCYNSRSDAFYCCQFVTYGPRYSLLSTFLTIRHDCTWTIKEWRKRETERETAWGGIMVSASRMGLLDCFGLHWAECASNNWASGPHLHFNLCTMARKMSLPTPMLWPLCCRGCESGYSYSACRLSLSAQAMFSLQHTLYCCWSTNRKCKSQKTGSIVLWAL